MNYLWENFTIPVFKANTIVFMDGVFMPELSDPGDAIIQDTLVDAAGKDLPVHIIIQGGDCLPRKITVRPGAKVFLTAILDGFNGSIDIDANADSEFSAGIYILNKGTSKIDLKANHIENNSSISANIYFEILENSKTFGNLSVNIPSNISGAMSDLNFSVLADNDIQFLKLSPSQFVSSVPDSAKHGAGTVKATPAEIQFLKSGGLTNLDVNNILREAFRGRFTGHLSKVLK